MTNTRHQDFTTGNPKVFFMVEAAYHYAAKFNTQAEAAKYAQELNKTHKNRFGHDAYGVAQYSR